MTSSPYGYHSRATDVLQRNLQRGIRSNISNNTENNFLVWIKAAAIRSYEKGIISNRISGRFGEQKALANVHIACHILKVRLACNFVDTILLLIVDSLLYTYESRFDNWDEVITKLP